MTIAMKPALSEAAPDAGTLAAEILSCLTYRIGKDPTVSTQYDWLSATIKVVRDRLIEKWIASTKKAYEEQSKRVYYLSLEFLIGRLMRDAISNLRLMDEVKNALSSLGVDFDIIAALEPDAALGNGGLGRLAACFMESMATVDIPAHGYGIRYANGMFRQEISDGWQVELPETWLDHGNPWEFERRERSIEIGFGGMVEAVPGSDGRRMAW
jgi:starch phosphorylase